MLVNIAVESVVADYDRGATPEEIVLTSPSSRLPMFYYVIGYYLTNKPEVDAYIQHQKEEHERIRREWEAEHPPKLTKADLLARLESKKKQSRKE